MGRLKRLKDRPSPTITPTEVVEAMEAAGAEFFFSAGPRGTLRVRNLEIVPEWMRQMFYGASATAAGCVRSRSPVRGSNQRCINRDGK